MISQNYIILIICFMQSTQRYPQGQQTKSSNQHTGHIGTSAHWHIVNMVHLHFYYHPYCSFWRVKYKFLFLYQSHHSVLCRLQN